jgi:predicted RNase H-like nuclease (RuvC/YqgF family)
VRKKIENDQRKAEGKGVSNNSASTMNAIHKEIEEDDNRFIAGQGRQQEQKIAEQNEKLSVLGQGVDNLGVHAKIIKTELEEQNVILGELETDMDNAGDKMNVVMASLSKLLKTKDGCQLWTIVILAVVLIILVALIIWV